MSRNYQLTKNHDKDPKKFKPMDDVSCDINGRVMFIKKVTREGILCVHYVEEDALPQFYGVDYEWDPDPHLVNPRDLIHVNIEWDDE